MMSGKMSLIFVVALSTWSVCKSNVLWTWDQAFDDVIKVNNSQVRRAVNVGRCASLCTSNTSCSSFFFLPNTEECRLNEFVFATRGGGQSSPGARYFKAESGACPSQDGYVWLRGAGTCIKVYPDSKNFTNAYKTCVDAGTRLVVLDKEDRLRGVGAYLEDLVNPDIRAFIGGMRDGVVNGTRTTWNSTLDPLYWLNGVLIPISGPGSYWEQPDLNPSNSDYNEGCMEIISRLWNDIDCISLKAFICEKI